MIKNTGRDLVWHYALRHARAEEPFQLADIEEISRIDVNERTIRGVLNTLVNLGWLVKETSQGEEWLPGPLANGEIAKDESDDSRLDNAEAVADYYPSQLTEGKVYYGTVDRISGSGNAIISHHDSHINLGPIDESSLGETVRFERIHNIWCEKCIEDEYITENYISKLSEIREQEKKSTNKNEQNLTRSRRPGNKVLGLRNSRNRNELLNGKL